MRKFKITLFLVAALVGLCMSIPTAIKYLFIETNGGVAIVGLMALIYSGAIVSILVIERIIIHSGHFSPKKIFFVELSLILIAITLYKLDYSTYFFQVNDKVEWFAIHFDDNQTDRIGTYSFPNNRNLQIERNGVLFMNSHDFENKTITIKPMGEKWRGYSRLQGIYVINEKEISCAVYLPFNIQLTDTIESQIILDLERRPALLQSVSGLQ